MVYKQIGNIQKNVRNLSRNGTGGLVEVNIFGNGVIRLDISDKGPKIVGIV